jgi:hypothetical protein
MKTKKLLALTLVWFIFLVTIPPSKSQPFWTVMVYMDGDNNLETAAIDDFNELEAVGSTPGVNIVVQLDRIPGYDTSNGNWTTTQRYFIDNDPNGYPDSTIRSTMISDLGELNMGHPSTLINFVNWARTTYPADYYLLVLWDHGDGWKTRIAQVTKKGTLTAIQKREPLKGVCSDDTSNDYLDMPDLQAAFTTITSGGTDPVDVLGFDACLMAMVEVNYEIFPYASYAVASEESVPNDGWDYVSTMSWLVANPLSTPAQLASRIVSDYMNFYGVGGFETHSAADLSQISAIAAAVTAFAIDLINAIPLYQNNMINARNQTEEYMDRDYVDLYHFAQLIQVVIPDVGIQTDAQNVMNAITAAVISEGHGILHPDSHGLSIYFPFGGSDYLPSYETETEFAQDTMWDEFLAAYYSTLPPPIHTLGVIDDDNGRNFTHVEDAYLDALDALAIPYDYFDTCIFGSPPLWYLQAHDLVIWFTGSDFSTTLSAADENNLIQYLGQGKKLFFSSQDYVWDLKLDSRYPSTFLRTYLHTQNEGEDAGVNILSGVTGNPVGDGLGSINMCWTPPSSCSVIDYADWIEKDLVSEYAFYNENVEYIALTYSGTYEVVFFPFMFEGILLPSDREEIMERILEFLGPISILTCLEDCFSSHAYLVAGDSAYCTDVLGAAKISFALGEGGSEENPEGRTDIILTSLEHDTGNLIPVGGPAINPVADEFGTYFDVTYDYQPGVSFTIFADESTISLNLTQYPAQDIALIYVAMHNGRFVMLVWGYGWQGTYAASMFLGDPANWEAYKGAHLVMLRWNDTNSDGLVQGTEITVEVSS